MTPSVHRPTRAIISLPAIIHNYRTIKHSLAQNKNVIAVIKANGYGHGAVQLAQALQAEADGFAVAVGDEALELRAAGVQNPLLILGLTDPHYAWLHADQHIGLTFDSLNWLQLVYDMRNQLSDNKLQLHLKVDSGMGRIGIRNAIEGQEIVNFIAAHQDLFELTSIFTHFATADGISIADKAKIQEQITNFKTIVHALDFEALITKPKIHQSNTALSIWYPEASLDIVRLGIGLYGINPSNGQNKLPIDLKPALSLETSIIHIKQMQAGETISYGAAYSASEGEWIATLPIGYADGWSRNLIGLDALVNGERCPTVGRICMDQCMIRLPHEMPVGTKVTLIGQNGNECITAEEAGQHSGTIGYEIVCAISDRVPRVYSDN